MWSKILSNTLNMVLFNMVLDTEVQERNSQIHGTSSILYADAGRG